MDHAEEDEFFGDDNNDDEVCQLADREMKAVRAQYQNIGYLEAYDEYKEKQLQKGFEAGYQETYDIARRLGYLLGQLNARNQFLNNKDSAENDDSEIKVVTKHISRRYRETMDIINRSNDDDSGIDVRAVLIDLEHEVKNALENV